MISRTVLALLALTVAAPAFADDAIKELTPRRTEDIEAVPPREQVFISPSGEPFRAPLGEPYPMGAWFARVDADGDGALSAEEFTADQLAFFGKLDTSQDGVVDGFETSEYERTIAPEVTADPAAPRRRRGWMLGMRERPRPSLRGAAHYGLINDPLPVRSPDTDFDYRVTRDELLAAAHARFDLLDKNNDGRIPLSELPGTRMQAELRRLK